MTSISPNVVSMADLIKWDELQKQLAPLKAQEMLMRKKIFDGMFPSPKEGTNKVALNAGYVLVGKHVINRKLDEPVLTVMNEEFRAAGINTNALIERKPSLVLSAYRELTAEQQHFFDRALIVTPGSPALEIVLPAAAKKAAEKAAK